MLKIKKILFPTDFSRCANQAFTHALYLARQHQAELHILHVIVLLEDDPHHPAHHFPDKNEIHARLKEIAAAQMSADIRANQAGDLKITQVQQRSISTAPAILDYANENDIDLIVMGTHGRRGLGHLLLGSVAEEVVRVASCPVLTIREHEEPTPIEAIEQILVPVDFSGHSKKALAYAKEMAATYNARLHLLHVIEDVKYPAFYMSGRLSYFDIVPEVEAKSREALKKFLEDAGMSEATADIHVIEGHAAGDIVKFAASHSIDLVVIATHGLTGLDHFLLGSVTEKVVRRAPCPVFTVKAFGKSLFSGTEGLS